MEERPPQPLRGRRDLRLQRKEPSVTQLSSTVGSAQAGWASWVCQSGVQDKPGGRRAAPFLTGDDPQRSLAPAFLNTVLQGGLDQLG